MNWTKGWRCLASTNKSVGRSESLYQTTNQNQNGAFTPEKVQVLQYLQSQNGTFPARSLSQDGLWGTAVGFQERLVLLRNLVWRFMLPGGLEGNASWLTQRKIAVSHKYGHSVENGRWYSGAPLAEQEFLGKGKPVLNQPPLSQSDLAFLEPESPEEAQVALLLARSNLLITRDIEWANLILGFEQENQYAIVDVCYPQSPVGFIREQSNLLARQLLRNRRPFVAYITDGMGNELFRVRRPFWWISSSIYAEIDGKEIGVVHRRWHLWTKIYDLYLGYLKVEIQDRWLWNGGSSGSGNDFRNKQFAVLQNPLWGEWIFTLKDIDGKVLAEIDRNWRGYGFEIFTDAGQYVIRFESSDAGSKIGPATMIQELEVARPLTLSERAVAVALAISLDNDYYSRLSGWASVRSAICIWTIVVLI